MNINEIFFYYINNNLQNPFFDAVMPFITDFGGFLGLFIIVIAIILYAKLRNRQTLKKIAILALIALLFSDVIAYGLKIIVQEPRPFMTLDHVRLLIREDDLLAFPSGHATSTLAVVSLFLLNIEDLVKKHYVIVSILLVVFAVAILFSRIYCGVHYPFDVLAGALIGIAGALVVNRFKDRIFSLLKL
ncbi:MAG: phosphatase PAP2 family protein [Methanobrevibacter thaueri]|jgi:undecaprenyl-diphosphatase|uniref:phosphatase PAP2 family protein n=1 Tax=Methanobrevibacter thaueri TaxID=190975 RepID=UPI0026E9F3BE|nr:phosphatase PAP2 family protein [Methanobrevibacter thaueri]MBE6494853.1 phosphatase PAP2 family protein [Methanobrevibacter thaueri]